ncbi:unnamed protein product [Lathyrus sativus]|nr:unnamed protein product [Lathyrus sativus]
MTPVKFLVIDDAAQLKECESTIPLQLPGLSHCILIGDERQLPALVKSKAEVTMMKLNEEKHAYNKEKDMLKKELEALKRKSNAKVQKGFSLLFVCMVAIVDVAVGYYIQL